MNSLWPLKPASAGSDAAKNTNSVDVADTGVVVDVPIADIGPELPSTTTAATTAVATTATTTTPSLNTYPARPSPQRNQLPLNPPNQPPPAVPNTPQTTDSLSLAQLRRFVSEFPKAEAAAYDFEYADTASHAEEIDEWFSYQFWQFVRLNNAQRAYESQWEHDLAAKENEVTWDEAADDVKSTFVRQALNEIMSKDSTICAAATGKLVYLVLGRWADTAGLPTGLQPKLRTLATPRQLAAMKAGVKVVAELGGVPIIWQELRNALDSVLSDEAPKTQAHRQEVQDALMNFMTIMYIFIQVVLGDPEGMESVRDQLLSLQPRLPIYMLTITTKLRFFEPKDDSIIFPYLQVILMLWKSILLVFGGTKEINETKLALRECPDDDKDKNLITASPLDYHIFRQEITSKYPAYIPPQLKIPLDADSVSLLPPLPNHPTRNNGSNGIIPAPPGIQSGGGSILHQSVHIATPAPSPPPSPAAGKGGKKQNYQTNQNFPFLYPPLDETSNSAGGKGAAGFQQFLVGRKWEGSDVPASILEAGELFSKRVRMTRSTRQLWEQREEFQKFERGWNFSEIDNDDISEWDLDALGSDDDQVDPGKLLEFIENKHKKTQAPKIDYGPHPEDLSSETKRRLEAVEEFYKASLPHLQSLIIVLMKGLISTVTACMTAANFNVQAAPGPVPPRESGRPVWNRSVDSSSGINNSINKDLAAQTNDADFAARNMEIESKASSAVILLLLKWLKVSHVLKFEYVTQLLLDSNYIPLVLKLFAHQDVQQVVDSTADHIEHSFFHFCNQSAHPGDKILTEPTEIDVADDESEDDAAPPPIKRRRSPAGAEETQTENEGSSKQTPEQKEQHHGRPEVDELGYPVNPLPKEPITDFSWRNFFTLINYLRIAQKICKNKAHRNLLLVQYKSSAIIRKSLKIPQNELRLYTLKLFKNQVPYCGRKWRQSNMRVITAVYLHCRPELRDEWLAGSDVDAEVEEAVPLEQALRSLTHWFNVRAYPDQMVPEIRAALQDEQDFFKRELEKLEVWNEIDVAGLAQNEGARMEWEQPQQHAGPGQSWG